MPHLSENEIREKLRARGVADHVIQGGAAGLIAAWRRFVLEVEQGYPLGLDDYRNDLDLRELIWSAGIESEVADEDRRLRAALVDADRAIWESEAPDAFWVRGYPHNASGELLDELRAEGIGGRVEGNVLER